jgi:transcriptional regulator of acetoin/glycerol metabolism
MLAAMGDSTPAVMSPVELKPLREVERDHVHRALLSTDWNISRTSEILDISRVTLRKKIDDFGLVKAT